MLAQFGARLAAAYSACERHLCWNFRTVAALATAAGVSRKDLAKAVGKLAPGHVVVK